MMLMKKYDFLDGFIPYYDKRKIEEEKKERIRFHT